MAGVSVKMGVSGVSQFKQGMNESKEAVKTLNEALKANESWLKLTGDQEGFAAKQAGLLKSAIDEQRKTLENASKAMMEMVENGVDPSSKAYQKMAQEAFKAQTKMQDMQKQLQDLESGTGSATDSTGAMNEQLERIGQNVGWDNVAEGIGKITDKMQSAARAAINLGKRIAKSAMGSAEWADNLKTTAAQYGDMGIDAEMLQRMENVSAYIDTDVDTILAARQRLNKTLATNGGKQTLEETLGLSLGGQNAEDLFWEVGDALLHMNEAFDKETAAQKLFGKGWRELIPLFTEGRENYEAALESQNVLTNEQVDQLGAVDDAFKSVEQQIELMKNQFWADNADKIKELLQWLIDNKDGVVTAVLAIGGAFAALKLAELAANIGKVVSGFNSLKLMNGGEAATQSLGESAGSAPGFIVPNFMDNLVNGMGVKMILDDVEKITGSFRREVEGLSADEAYKKTTMQTFNLTTDEEFQKFIEMLEPTEGTSGGRSFDVEIDPEVPENAAEQLSEQIGEVPVTVIPITGPRRAPTLPGHANGLWSVPYDGYVAMLHKGERIQPAREANHTYSSNLYVESMYMNNGQDAEGLAARMAAAQRRTMSGYGAN